MTARTILQWPNSKLLQHSLDVVATDTSVLELSRDLYHTMIVSYGAGIAAPQIGVHSNVCIISSSYVPSLPRENRLSDLGECSVLVNPQIEFLTNEKFKWEESCLSVPYLSAVVSRAKKIRLTYENLAGETIVKDLEGTESATVQHEVDHLLGKLFIHRLSGVSRQTAMRKIRRRILKQKQKRDKVEDAETRKTGVSEMSDAKRVVLRKKRKKKNKTYGKNKR